ncbi:hypothetical protein WG66_012320 [Moniliophthora roreri]|nr:hypothetical protein WG66_012320 [Moniliophthora roreri]
MNPIKANTDEKKKMLLLSLVKGNTSEWKQRETMKLFPEDDDPEEKKKAAEENGTNWRSNTTINTNWKKREPTKPKITRKEKEVTVGRLLSESDRKDYMVAGKCFRCAKTGHVSRDCPLKGQAQQTPPPKYEPKKLSPREAFTKIRALIAEQGEGEQEEIFDLMGKEGF